MRKTRRRHVYLYCRNCMVMEMMTVFIELSVCVKLYDRMIDKVVIMYTEDQTHERITLNITSAFIHLFNTVQVANQNLNYRELIYSSYSIHTSEEYLFYVIQTLRMHTKATYVAF